jgi:hypothetical protein
MLAYGPFARSPISVLQWLRSPVGKVFLPAVLKAAIAGFFMPPSRIFLTAALEIKRLSPHLLIINK